MRTLAVLMTLACGVSVWVWVGVMWDLLERLPR